MQFKSLDEATNLWRAAVEVFRFGGQKGGANTGGSDWSESRELADWRQIVVTKVDLNLKGQDEEESTNVMGEEEEGALETAWDDAKPSEEESVTVHVILPAQVRAQLSDGIADNSANLDEQSEAAELAELPITARLPWPIKTESAKDWRYHEQWNVLLRRAVEPLKPGDTVMAQRPVDRVIEESSAKVRNTHHKAIGKASTSAVEVGTSVWLSAEHAGTPPRQPAARRTRRGRGDRPRPEWTCQIQIRGPTGVIDWSTPRILKSRRRHSSGTRWELAQVSQNSSASGAPCPVVKLKFAADIERGAVQITPPQSTQFLSNACEALLPLRTRCGLRRSESIKVRM